MNYLPSTVPLDKIFRENSWNKTINFPDGYLDGKVVKLGIWSQNREFTSQIVLTPADNVVTIEFTSDFVRDLPSSFTYYIIVDDEYLVGGLVNIKMGTGDNDNAVTDILIDGDKITFVQIYGNEIVSGLVTRAETAAESAEDNAEQTGLDRAAIVILKGQTDDNATATSQDRAAVVTLKSDVTQLKADTNQIKTDTNQIKSDTVIIAGQIATDKVVTGQDRVQTGLDRVATADDRVQTGLDKVATAADRVQTGLDVASTLANKNSAALSADAAKVNSKVFSTIAEALASTTPVIPVGDNFLVQGSGDVAAFAYKRTGVSTYDTLPNYPSGASVSDIKSAVGVSSVIETSTRTPNSLTKGSGLADDKYWENNFAVTAKAYESFTITFIRWAGTGALNIYYRVGSVFTLLGTVTPADTETRQSFTINQPVPSGVKLSVNGNIGYRSGSGVGLQPYTKSTGVAETNLPTFEITYTIEFALTTHPIIPVSDQLATLKTDVTGGTTKTIKSVDDSLASFKGQFGADVDFKIKTLSPNAAIASGVTPDIAKIWVNQWPPTVKTYQYLNISFVRISGTNPIYVYLYTGGIFTLVSTITPIDTSSIQTVKINIVVPVGSLVAIRGNIGYTASGGIGVRPYDATTFAAGTLLATTELKFRVEFVNEIPLVVQKGYLTIKNSDKVFFIGNSYTEGGYNLRMKHYTNSISMLADFLTVGYGIGGNTLQQLYDAITADTPLQGWIKPSGMDISYAVIALITNNSNTAEAYTVVLAKLCDKLESMGIQPIIASEHFSANNGASGRYIMALSDFANKRGYTFINWGNFAQKNRVTGFNPFQYPTANHVGTRAYWAWVGGLMPYLSQITVRKSIKLFRQRAGTDFTTLPEYYDNFERARYFEELEIGTKAHSAANEINFDRQNTMTPSGGTYVGTVNDYANIINNNAVSFGSYALASIVLDNWNLTSVILNLESTGITNAYIKSHSGAWIEVPFSSAINLGSYIKGTYGRKIAIVFKGTSITISDINVAYTGTNPVNQTRILKPSRITTNSQFTADFTGGNWTFGTGVTNYVPVVDPSDSAEIEELPIGITVVKELNTIGEYVSTSFTPAGINTDSVDLQIRILARNFPTFIDTDAKWATSKLTSSSFDMAKMKITITQGSNIYVCYKYVGLWWDEIIFNSVVYGATAVTIRVESADDYNLQLSSVGAYS